MINFTGTHLELSRPVCKALLAFACKDKTRPRMCCIGFNCGDVCATDGYTAVRFFWPTSPVVMNHNLASVFPRAYVETQLRVATATKSDIVQLEWNEQVNEQFPPLEQAERDQISWQTASTVGVSGAYLARLSLVADACRGDCIDPPAVRFVSLTDPSDPISFEVDGTEHNGVKARVTIMPIRLS